VASPRFYVACPLGDRTGGPEALALMVHSIRKRGYEAFLIPMRNFRGKRPHPEYDHYDYALADRMPRDDNAQLVLTEVSPIESKRELDATADENIWMFWLSVNFSPIPRARYFKADENVCSFLPPGGKPWTPPVNMWPHDDEEISSGKFRTVREASRRRGGFSLHSALPTMIESLSIEYAERTVRRNINFGTQSFYGQGFVRTELGGEAFQLTDYPRLPQVRAEVRDRNLVLYNGAKGKWKIPDLEALLPDVNFMPIQGLTFDEVSQLLSRAALYVEIGHLPGRDRLAREAANYGTPTVLLARGAGYCWNDFPLGEKYRIPYTTDWASHMAPVIREVLSDPSEILLTQEHFRDWVAGEPARYDQAMDEWIGRVVSR
jgi:hypothetical protein